jgi:two-component system CheB/CheR fusion protein
MSENTVVGGEKASQGFIPRRWNFVKEKTVKTRMDDNLKSAGPLGSKARSLPEITFPIIGLGASAGGLEAFEQFFRHIAPDSGMAFILVSHLDPGRASMLTEILQRTTTMTVLEAQDQMIITPNRVYVIPPNRDLAVFHGTIQLSVPEGHRGQRMPIDFFLRSLAEDLGERAIGVILSGSGSDGTLGLRAIIGAGGVSFVQDPVTAKYDGMPASVIQAGLATFILRVEQMPEQLVLYKKTFFEKKIKSALPPPTTTGALDKIMMIVRSKTGHDFSLYKQSTIRRRIERRMNVHNIEDTDTYARFLKEDISEAQLLFKEFLINVTSFFRDPEAFTMLKKDILPALFAQKPENYCFRIWVPGCATGEEPYSIAILFREFMDEIKQEYKVQIYGTDIDEDSIRIARSAIYPANISLDVSPERLRRFFVKEETGFRVKKDIREMVIFATQNAIKDPPFTRLDFLSCRNLLIYLEAELQGRLFPAFHYALKPGGVLFLSHSESIGSFTDLFAPISKKWKFFRARESLSRPRTGIAHELTWRGDLTERGSDEVVREAKETNFSELTKQVLLQSYAPPSVVTDEKGNILFFYGDTGKYLRPAPGQASLNVIEMAREGLQMELRTAIQRVVKQKKPVIRKDLLVKTNGVRQGVNLTVKPVTGLEAPKGLLLVGFQEAGPQVRARPTRAGRPARKVESTQLEELEKELLYNKESHQSTIEELQAANEELNSANEELQSLNEEMQSTNEELETSKEELQSVNEEILTVNAELQDKIEQLSGIQNDMKNLIDNTHIGIIFLDENLAINRFTHEAAKVFRLVGTDVGRPLGDIKANLKREDLEEEARAVLDSLLPRELEVKTTGDEWFLVRIMPYRTLENVAQGVVLTFNDITRLKTIEEEVREARDTAQSIVDMVRGLLIVLDGEFKVISASRSFYQAFQVKPEETVGRSFFDLGGHQWADPRLQELLKTILPKDSSFEDMEVEDDFPIIGHRRMLLNARRIPAKTGGASLILLAMEDVTGK